jgi:hypothetical protein
MVGKDSNWIPVADYVIAEMNAIVVEEDVTEWETVHSYPQLAHDEVGGILIWT